MQQTTSQFPCSSILMRSRLPGALASSAAVRGKARAARLTLVGICLAMATVPLWAQVSLTGDNTVPPAPATLKANDPFGCGDPGSGLLEYPDGTRLVLKPGCRGVLLPDGLRLQQGSGWMSFRKKGGSFVIRTPMATIAIRGTEFGLTVEDRVLRLTLVNGAVEVTPVAGRGAGDPASIRLAAGQVLMLKGDSRTVRAITPADLQPWDTARAQAARVATASSALPRFSDQFPYGWSVLEAGTVELIAADGTRRTLTKGSVARAGATLETPTSGQAKVSLLGGSSIRLAPDSRLRLGSASVRLERGAGLIRHVGRGAPLRLDGPTAIRIERDSLVEAEQTAEGLILRVQVGSVFLPQTKRRIAAGECVVVGPAGAKTPATRPSPRAWDHPSPGTGSASPPPVPDPDSSQPAGSGSGSDASSPTGTGSDDLTGFRDALGF